MPNSGWWSRSCLARAGVSPRGGGYTSGSAADRRPAGRSTARGHHRDTDDERDRGPRNGRLGRSVAVGGPRCVREPGGGGRGRATSRNAVRARSAGRNERDRPGPERRLHARDRGWRGRRPARLLDPRERGRPRRRRCGGHVGPRPCHRRLDRAAASDHAAGLDARRGRLGRRDRCARAPAATEPVALALPSARGGGGDAHGEPREARGRSGSARDRPARPVLGIVLARADTRRQRPRCSLGSRCCCHAAGQPACVRRSPARLPRSPWRSGCHGCCSASTGARTSWPGLRWDGHGSPCARSRSADGFLRFGDPFVTSRRRWGAESSRRLDRLPRWTSQEAWTPSSRTIRSAGPAEAIGSAGGNPLVVTLLLLGAASVAPRCC